MRGGADHALVFLDLTADHGLANASEPGQVPLGWSMAEYGLGTLPPTWYSEPVPQDIVIGAAHVTLSFAAEQATTSLLARPEYTAWFGVEDRFGSHLFFDGPPYLVAGAPATVGDWVSPPPGGLVVPAGERIALRVASYMADAEGANQVDLVVGDESAPSRVALTVRPIELPEARVEHVLDEQGALEGTRCTVADPTGTATATFPLEVPVDAVGLNVTLARLGGTGAPDLDFLIFDPAGNVVWGGEGSGGDEAAVLLQPNLEAVGPGSWSIYVFSCQPQVVDYKLDAWLLLAR